MDSTQLSQPLPPSLHPAAGWGALQALEPAVMRGGLPRASALREQHAPGGFTWAKPHSLQPGGPAQIPGADPTVLQLISEPFDTGAHHLAHFRTLWDTRSLLFMHPHDMVARGLVEGDLARVTTVSGSEHLRELACMRVVPYDLPRGSVGGYFPECHALLAGQRHARAGQQPANARICVRVRSVTA